MLARTGGRGGKLYNDTVEWDYLPDDCSVNSTDDEDEVIDHIPFTSIKDVTDALPEYEKDEHRLHDDCAYQIVNVHSLESLINEISYVSVHRRMMWTISLGIVQGHKKIHYQTDEDTPIQMKEPQKELRIMRQ